ncbi:MAG: hypothetical protein JNL80_18580 [Phycisphaerae bacterium]|nr:hypothetical protein [Phycisphaerae bacterium]
MGLFTCLAVTPVTLADTQALQLPNETIKNLGYVRIADAPSLEPPTFTIEAWIRPMGPGVGGGDVWGCAIVNKPTEGGSTFVLPSYMLGWSPTTKRITAIGRTEDGVNFNGFSTTLVQVGESVHAAMTFDGTWMRVYVNGVLESTVPSPGGAIAYGAEDVLLGASNFSGGKLRRFDGVIDEVRIWSTVRSAAQIEAAFQCPLPCTDRASLEAWYRFEGGSLEDFSDGGHPGTMVGSGSFIDGVTQCQDPIVSGDVDGDLCVGAIDLALLLGAWGSTQSPADFDFDGEVGASDLAILLGAWNG